MNVILAHMAFDNLNVIGLTDLAKQVSNTTRHILLKGLVAIFVHQTRWISSHECCAIPCGNVSFMPLA